MNTHKKIKKVKDKEYEIEVGYLENGKFKKDKTESYCKIISNDTSEGMHNLKAKWLSNLLLPNYELI